MYLNESTPHKVLSYLAQNDKIEPLWKITLENSNLYPAAMIIFGVRWLTQLHSCTVHGKISDHYTQSNLFTETSLQKLRCFYVMKSNVIRGLGKKKNLDVWVYIILVDLMKN